MRVQPRKQSHKTLKLRSPRACSTTTTVLHVLCTQLVINGKHQDLPSNPHKLVLPSSGSLDLYFVDLRPVETPAPPPAPPPPPPSTPPSSTLPPAAVDQPQAQARKVTSPEQDAPIAPGMRFKSAALAAAAAFKASRAASAAEPKVQPVQGAPPTPKGAPPIPAKEPVVLAQPVLMQQPQMDALVAALQHWKMLDPYKSTRLRDPRFAATADWHCLDDDASSYYTAAQAEQLASQQPFLCVLHVW
eukprot:1141689-Pelagomonas_calceolata.AAC.2